VNHSDNNFRWYVGIDGGSQKHRVCILDAAGKILQQKWFEHSGSSLAELVNDLRLRSAGQPGSVAVAIEVPHGAIVETLVEHGFAVFAINPKQLDRFRDRFTPAGAKDDQRDALVLADSLRTDRHCFAAVRLDEPTIIRLRELSRLEEDLSAEQNRVANQLWQQLHRYFPQLLELSSAADEPWLWDLLEAAPLPAQAAQLPRANLEQILHQRRIRRFTAPQLQEVLRKPSLKLAPGAAEAASEHVLLLLPRLRLLQQQRAQIGKRIDALLEELQRPGADPKEHRDATILLSLPGVGRKVTVTMLSEASQAIADRDYHALRCYGGVAPVTRQSGKKKVVRMRYGCNERLRNAMYHWARVSTICDRKSRQSYAERKSRGQLHGRALRGIGDRWLPVLIAMLRSRTLFDPEKRAA
jgi:transposase